MRWLLYLFLTFYLLSCNSSQNDKEKELLRKEKELLIKENELLKKEKALQQSSKKETPPPIQHDTLPEELQVSDIIGTWDVSMQCVSSDCDNVSLGDIRPEKWIISYEQSKVIARVENNSNTHKIYKGSFHHGELSFSSQIKNLFNSSEAIIFLKIKNRNIMTGSRRVRNKGDQSCEIVYDLTVKRGR